MSTPPSASDPPLAYGEELTHTNADLSHMILDGLHATATAPSRPPRRLPVVTRATRFAPSRDPGEDGLVRVEVLALGPREIGGLAIDELRVELFETKTPPHRVVVSTDAPGDACPASWEAVVDPLVDDDGRGECRADRGGRFARLRRASRVLAAVPPRVRPAAGVLRRRGGG